MKWGIWLVVALAALMVGCGGGKNQPANNAGPLDPQGNWAFTFTDSEGVQRSVTVAGQLYELAPPTVTSNGMLATIATGGFCNGSIVMGGSASGTNSITLTTSQMNPGPSDPPFNLTLTGTIADDQAHMSGTWTAPAGEACVMNTSGTWTALVIQPMSGAWHGTLTEASGKALNIGAAFSLTEDTSQTSPTMGAVNGTLTLTNSTCYTQPITIAGSNPGFLVNLSGTASDGSKIGIAGTINAAATQFSISSLTVSGGACDGENFSGTVTR